MIFELVEVMAAATAAGGATGITLRRRRARLLPTQHELCLREIDRLERELFPEWFPQPSVVEMKRQVERQLLIGGFDVDELDLRPGAMWPVHDLNHVQIVSTAYSMTSCSSRPMLSRQLAARGLLDSSEAAAHAQHAALMGVQLQLPTGDEIG